MKRPVRIVDSRGPNPHRATGDQAAAPEPGVPSMPPARQPSDKEPRPAAAQPTAEPDLTDFPSVDEVESSGAPRAPRIVKAPRREELRLHHDLVGKQKVQGSLPGDRYVRIFRQPKEDFERAAPGHLVATEEANEPRGSFGRVVGRIKRRVIGAPLTSASAAHERLTKLKALAVLSSDALSSVAYATEEILRVLVLAGLSALSLSLPIGAAIIVLLIIVGVSYRQTIQAYPHGGGSYIVAKDNLGELPALAAAAALLFGYVLTVAVSISAGVAALVSAVPALRGHLVLLGLTFIALVTIVNLRGIRESGSIFAVPTYLFLIGLFGMLAVGLFRNALDGFAVHEPATTAGALETTQTLGVILILRAFSSGCAALTGVEAISDGVPAFHPPEWKNARTTLTWMISILAVTFAGITFLAHQYGAVAIDPEEAHYQTVVSQIARQALGGQNIAYYYVQFATLSILILAANTAYSDFPRLASFLARDGFVPRQFGYRGDRLAFSTGIVTLGVLSAALLVIFGGKTERLIPLYAFGVFTAFTLSESGMVVRWIRLKSPGWQRGLAINLAGAIATGVVAIVFGASNFLRGAWIVAVLIPVVIVGFRAIHHHYARVADELARPRSVRQTHEIKHTIVVPIAAINSVAEETIAYARSLSSNVTAVHIANDEDAIPPMRDAWTKLSNGVPLVIIESPYRALVGPFLSYLDAVEQQRPQDTVTVVLPEFVARHWWEHMLHNQSALRLKASLLFRPNTVVISVPYHLER